MPLNAVLSLVDIRSGANSYYKLQVLQHDKNKRYEIGEYLNTHDLVTGVLGLCLQRGYKSIIESFRTHIDFVNHTGYTWVIDPTEAILALFFG